MQLLLPIAILCVSSTAIASPPDVHVPGGEVGLPAPFACYRVSHGEFVVDASRVPEGDPLDRVEPGTPIQLFACEDALPPGLIPDVGSHEVFGGADVRVPLPATPAGNCARVSASDVTLNTTRAHEEGGAGWVEPGTPVELFARC